MCLLFSILYSRCDLCATAPCGFQAHTSSILINVQFLFVHYEAFLSSTKLRTIILTSSSDNPILVFSSLYTSVFLYDGRRPVKLKNPSKPVFSTVPEDLLSYLVVCCRIVKGLCIGGACLRRLRLPTLRRSRNDQRKSYLPICHPDSIVINPSNCCYYTTESFCRIKVSPRGETPRCRPRCDRSPRSLPGPARLRWDGSPAPGGSSSPRAPR